MKKTTIKCDLIPHCSLCRLYQHDFEECNVDIPSYIPDELIDKLLHAFKKKNYYEK